MLKERRRGGGSRGASTHRVHDGASLLRSPVPDLGLGHSSEDEAEGWADDEELLGEEGSGTSSAVRRGGRPAVAAVHRQESTTTLQQLAVHAHTQSAGERCVVGAVVAYACLLVLSAALVLYIAYGPGHAGGVLERAAGSRWGARSARA